MSGTWRDTTPTELEAQYDNRAAVPEHPEIFERWRADSDRTRAELDGRLNLPYGSDPRQSLDLFLPEVLKPPLHVFVHGGYWQALDKDHFSFLARGFVDRGIAFAALGYRLCPAVRVDDIVEDVRQGCLTLHRQHHRLGIDPERVQVSGHSAGGHLIAMLMATRWRDYGRKIPDQLMQSALSLSGLFELEPLLTLPPNVALGLDESSARRLSPALLVPQCRIPLVLAVGEDESAEYHRQSAAIDAAWGERGVAVDSLSLPGHNHFTIVDELTATGLLFGLAVSMLESA
jgi:arylformamidase